MGSWTAADVSRAQTRRYIQEARHAGKTALAADLKALGLMALPDSPEVLMAAWREAVKRGAPDMDALKQTRERVRTAMQRINPAPVNQALDSACAMCGGSGRIGDGFGRVCPSCKGTGQAT